MHSHLRSIAEQYNQKSGLLGCVVRFLSLAVLFGVVPSSAGMAQSDQSIGVEERPLIDRQPFDLIILTQAAGGHRVPIATLPERAFPQRPTDATKLEVVLLSHLDRRYEITWRDIEKIEFYEQMVYDEALKKMAAKDYIGAFQNLSFLLQNYPQMSELENLRRKFLFQSAATMFGDGKLLQTMSTLEELRSSAPNYEANNVINGLSRITDAVIKSYVDKNDLSSALKVLDRLEQQYGDAIPSVKTWRDDLNKRAEMQLARAKEMMEQHKYREARKSISALLSLYPRHTVGLQLMEQLNKEHPMIRVGVMQRGTEPDPSSLISRPARRVGNLTRRALFEFLQTGPEGGKYGFAFGTFRQSEDRQQLTLTFDPSQKSQVTPQQISQILLRRAKVSNPEYDPSWAAILKSVSIPNSQQVLLTLQRPHVLPHSLLQLPLMDEEGKDLIPGPYNVGSADEDENSFVIRNRDPGSSQPVEVVEHFYQDAKAAVNDLLRGELDVLDQVFPADARRLGTLERVKIASYALPSVHMLLPISDYPYLEKDKFRRALLYAVDRTNVLSGELLGGTSSPDGRVVSGPFPMGS
ncbi:MAG: ABC transporter substrate-binding protein, partial [Pirellulales bacterium]